MRILIIEDEAEIMSFIKKGLTAENFAVDSAMDGESGFSMAKNNEYDAVIIDILLPGMNGIEVCKQIRAQKKSLPIIMLSVQADTDIKINALNSGADDYLTKPFSFEELLARIRALLRRERNITDEKLVIADLEMDIARHTVTRAGKEVMLNKKEFSLLEYLMRNPRMTLTRNMILEHVWDMNADPFTNTVDVHIRFLRKKIDEHHARKLIHTVHGYGYKIE